jgi:hypothetical protein
VAELPSLYAVENQRRSVAMLSPGQWALKREDALDVLAQLVAALKDLRRLKQTPRT